VTIGPAPPPAVAKTAAAPRPAPTQAGAASDSAIRVLICDDSAVIRSALARMLESDPRIRLVARAANGQEAVAAVRREQVDVIVLDIEMPVMDGMTALPLLLQADPGVRVVMASTLTTRGADIALRALRLGAADYLPKPSVAQINDNSFRTELLAKITGLGRLRRGAAVGHSLPHAARAAPGSSTTPNVPAAPLGKPRPGMSRPARLLAIGSSTGGPQALFTLVQSLGRDITVPVVLTQHMPATFTAILAEHITKLDALPCAEARDQETLKPGRIYLAPGDRHLMVDDVGGALRARLSSDPPENFCRPAVDPMLRTACVATGGRMLIVMLTGMGQDGLLGTKQVVEAGGCALAQDEATSVVWGMPGAIARAGLCHAVLPLPQLGPQVQRMLRGAA
jgi:two-component system chemotaxis response regulator CheB